MRKISRNTLVSIIGATFLVFLPVIISVAHADSTYYTNSAQFGMTLPQASLPSGQDEIRTSDGTSCRSSVGGNGNYMDVGVIGAPQTADMQASAAAYGRVVIPFGQQSKRLDCTKLYNLEIERLKMELQLAKMGLGSTSSAPAPAAKPNESWAEDGWSTEPSESKAANKAAPKPAATSVATKADALETGSASVIKAKAKVTVKKQAPLLGVKFPAPIIATSNGLY